MEFTGLKIIQENKLIGYMDGSIKIEITDDVLKNNNMSEDDEGSQESFEEIKLQQNN